MRLTQTFPVAWLLLAGSPAFSAEPPLQPHVEAARSQPEIGGRPPGPGRMMFEAGVFGGAFIPSAEHELYDSLQSFHSSFELVGPKMGLRLGFFPVKILGVEAEAGYAPIQNVRRERNHLFDTRGHVVLQGPWQVSPFVLVGGGLIGVKSRAGDDIDDALHWGGGVKLFATRRLHLRFDGRHIITGAEGPRAGNTNHVEVTAGLGFVLFQKDDEVEVVHTPQPPPLLAEPRQKPSPVIDAPPPEVVVARRVLYVEAMDPVRFQFDSSDLPERFRPILLEVVQMMEGRPDLDVVVVGHADATGPAAYNVKLSERRAKAVALFFVLRGIAKSRIRLRGEGEQSPIATNETKSGRARNRRTELTVVERRQSSTDSLDAAVERILPGALLRKEEGDEAVEPTTEPQN